MVLNGDDTSWFKPFYTGQVEAAGFESDSNKLFNGRRLFF